MEQNDRQVNGWQVFVENNGGCNENKVTLACFFELKYVSFLKKVDNEAIF
ncbi:hypothetical protein QNI22_19590 [Cytophagaceae bacterium BD1B2-1]|uniref:Uncharacterized protein n=1 Tax=Xanthocytophaga agilis TaxID=3048010 RepID=A0AAE3R8T7_9BACT|nr:hypothetical protein [Xanthocytophaga agilis]